MANDTTSNITRKLLRKFLKKFESMRVVSKTVDTQLFTGRFTPASGSIVDIKRPHDYRAHRTPGGDISGETKSDIVSGKASAVVQDYITTATEWGNVEEALELDQLDEIVAPMATRIVTDLETDLADFMMKNASQAQGTVGTPVAAWSDVAFAGALMSSSGVPADSPWYYVFNPYTQATLADVQKGLAGNDSLIQTAWTKAQISTPMAGLQALSGVTLSNYTTGAGADRAGTVDGAPTQTYLSVKDSMQQTISVTAMDAALPIKAGDVIEIAGTAILNKSTRNRAFDETGSAIPFRAVVAADVTLTAGAGDIVISGPFINETNGQYNTAELVAGGPLVGGEVITVLGSAASTYQPNLFYHKQAFSMASVKLPKLYSTDTVVETEDGFSIRCSKYSDGDANQQKIRFDLLPAYSALNPHFAGHGWGSA